MLRHDHISIQFQSTLLSHAIQFINEHLNHGRRSQKSEAMVAGESHKPGGVQVVKVSKLRHDGRLLIPAFLSTEGLREMSDESSPNVSVGAPGYRVTQKMSFLLSIEMGQTVGRQQRSRQIVLLLPCTPYFVVQ